MKNQVKEIANRDQSADANTVQSFLAGILDGEDLNSYTGFTIRKLFMSSLWVRMGIIHADQDLETPSLIHEFYGLVDSVDEDTSLKDYFWNFSSVIQQGPDGVPEQYLQDQSDEGKTASRQDVFIKSLTHLVELAHAA